MASRYELSDGSWERIEGTRPGVWSMWQDGGGTPAALRQIVSEVLSGLRTGARWPDLPERYSRYKNLHTRFMRRARAGV